MLERDGVGSVRTIIAWLGSGCTCIAVSLRSRGVAPTAPSERAPASKDREVENGKLENHYDDDDYSGHASPPSPCPSNLYALRN
jgi:hypothetical protein